MGITNRIGHPPPGRTRVEGEEITSDRRQQRMAGESDRPRQESPPASSAGFDSYRSLADSNIRIIVAKDVVPPFRFKAGGWEFSQSSTELGSAIRARIAEKGFFMFRVSEDQTGGIELTDFPSRSQNETEFKGE
jgi:hypothetical protein